MAEIEITILERNALSRRLEDETVLRRRILAVETERNEQRRGIAWQFTRARGASQAGAALSGERPFIGLTPIESREETDLRPSENGSPETS